MGYIYTTPPANDTFCGRSDSLIDSGWIAVFSAVKIRGSEIIFQLEQNISTAKAPIAGSTSGIMTYRKM
jgi:hypothetical protein